MLEKDLSLEFPKELMMDFSEHSRNSSSDAGDQEVRHSNFDDMSSRRMGGNIPAPLRKKKDETYKRFITPTGDPMTYVKQHMRSKSLSDIQMENAAREQERDERNLRYEEMQKLKEMLREEEETWTSNLDNWKQRRRSATLDARKRKEDRETVVQPAATQRRPKTFKEMVEDKKQRDSRMSMFDDDNDDLWSSLPKDNSYSDTSTTNVNKTSKTPYRGAISVPDFGKVQSTRQARRSPSPEKPKPAAEPVRYTSKVTAVINHAPSKNTESPDVDKKQSARITDAKPANRDRIVSRVGKAWPPPSTEPVTRSFAPAIRNSEPQRFSKPSTYSSTRTQQRSQSPPADSHYSKNPVQLRHSSPRQNVKERPKSAYGSIGGNRAATLPRNYHSYSGPQPADRSSDFVQHRRSAFANKRNMWENMGHQKQHSSSTAAPQHLASLLKQDTERLYGSENEPMRDSTNTTPRQTTDAESIESRSPRENDFSEEQALHKPKIMNPSSTSNSSQTNNLHSWRSSESFQKAADPKSAYKHVSAPVSRNAFASKSATLPSKARIGLHDNAVSTDVIKFNKSENSPRENGVVVDAKPISRSSDSNLSSQYDEMKICINQRPKSEKGFGFTVKGGNEGRPVIVNAVSPGGAADICQLCVGDEILAINDVRLSASLTQDGIVKLIVDSVFTGNLSLDIKRYGKSKKTNPMRLSGTKVVMTPGGFVQVRSDKGKTPVISTKTYNGHLPSAADQEKLSVRPESPQLHDLPLPPPPEDLQPPKLSAMDRLSPKKPSPSSYRRASPLSNLINAAKSTSPKPQDYNRPKDANFSPPKNTSVVRASSNDPDDDLEYEVLKAQHDLEMEENYLQHERRQHEENVNLRKQLLEEQRLLEERDVKREEEKRRRIEAAKAEEQRLEEELRKIEAAKREQQKRREEEKRKLIENQSRFDPTFGHGEMNHWLIEEAERSRLAEEEGRRRANVLDYNTSLNSFDSAQRSSPSVQPQIPGSLQSYWNDPNTRATLL